MNLGKITMNIYTKLRRLSPYVRREVNKFAITKNNMLKNDFLFIHIPKAAGTSISKALFIEDPGHFSYADYYKKIANKEIPYSFAIVRDPWDRLASTYYYAKRHAIKYPYSSVAFVNEYECLNSFVKKWLTIENVKKHYFFRTSFDYVSLNGKVSVDFIGKFESLNDDFNEICSQIGINTQLTHENKNKVTDYRKLYDLESAEIVAKVYENDIKTFGYSF